MPGIKGQSRLEERVSKLEEKLPLSEEFSSLSRRICNLEKCFEDQIAYISATEDERALGKLLIDVINDWDKGKGDTADAATFGKLALEALKRWRAGLT